MWERVLLTGTVACEKPMIKQILLTGTVNNGKPMLRHLLLQPVKIPYWSRFY